MKVIPGIGFIATVVYGIYVLLGESPQQRGERACNVVMWTGDFAHAVSDAFDAEHTTLNSITDFTIKYDFKCQKGFWNFFYKDDYRKQLLDQGHLVEQNGSYEFAEMIESPEQEDESFEAPEQDLVAEQTIKEDSFPSSITIQ